MLMLFIGGGVGHSSHAKTSSLSHPIEVESLGVDDDASREPESEPEMPDESSNESSDKSSESSDDEAINSGVDDVNISDDGYGSA